MVRKDERLIQMVFWKVVFICTNKRFIVDHQEGAKKAWKRRLIIDNYAINQFINVVTFQVE